MPPRNSAVPKERVKFTRLCVDISTVGNPTLYGPWEEFHDESRATRLVEDSTRFLLVNFREPKSSGSQSNSQNASAREISKWLDKHIKERIVLGDRSYAYMGFTESQLATGRVLFFEEDDEWTVPRLKSHFGDLYPVYKDSGYGKYSARLGLSFSGTVQSLDVPHSEICLLDDLRATDGTICSDGCGLIRNSCATRLCKEMNFPAGTSVFQIRRGGIKGVLARATDVQFDNACMAERVQGFKSKNIAYRPSMYKYEGGPTCLEIRDISQPPRSARLNKYFILLLLTLGVPLKVFEELLQIQLDNIAAVLYDRDRAKACVEGELDSDGGGFDQELYEMLLAGHNMNEPHLETLLRRFQKRSLESLRDKMHIPVRDSMYLFGIVDHVGVLKEGEIFVNIPSRGGPQIGQFVVGRNPAYAPSDLRVMTGVPAPLLAHLTNCIVFSSRSAHSETDYMSGGDLDGDMYVLIADKTLHPPANLRTKFAPIKRSEPVRSKRITPQQQQPQTRRLGRRNEKEHEEEMAPKSVELFMNLRGKQIVRYASVQWMSKAGATPKLAASDVCLKLTALIEKALDITKSGEDVHSLWREFHMLQSTPEFVPVGWKNPIMTLSNRVPRPPDGKQTDFVCDPDLVCQNDLLPQAWETLISDTEILMMEYNQRLSETLRVDRQRSEADLSSRQLYSPREEKFADSFKREFMATHFPAMGIPVKQISEHCIKASAWYVVGYRHQKESFAWLGGRFLNFLKSVATNGGHMPISVGRLRTISRTNISNTGAELWEQDKSMPISGSSSRSHTARASNRGDADNGATSGSSKYHDQPDVTHLHESASSRSRISRLDASFRSLEEDVPESDSFLEHFRRLSMNASTPGHSRATQAPREIVMYPDDPPLIIRPARKEDIIPIYSSQRSYRSRTVSITSATTIRAGPIQAIREPSLGPSTSPTMQIDRDKPKQPVASQAEIPPCPSDGGAHRWKITANAFSRKYECRDCPCTVKEKKDPKADVGWQTASVRR